MVNLCKLQGTTAISCNFWVVGTPLPSDWSVSESLICVLETTLQKAGILWIKSHYLVHFVGSKSKLCIIVLSPVDFAGSRWVYPWFIIGLSIFKPCWVALTPHRVCKPCGVFQANQDEGCQLLPRPTIWGPVMFVGL